jgi:hypothetical protein
MKRLGQVERDPSVAVGWKRLAVLWLVAALLLAFKSPDAWVNPQFWAEDGTIFFASQYREAWPQVLLTHAGYLHATPRLVAWFASIFPLAMVPAAYATAAFLIVSSVLAWSTSQLRPLLGIALFGGIALLPTNGEVFGTLTNVQWFIQIALIVVAFASPRSDGRARPFASTMIAVAALTGPFSTLIAAVHFFSLALQRLAPGRIFKAAAPAFEAWRHLPLYFGGVVQLLLAILSEYSPPVHWARSVEALAATPLHVFGDGLGSSPFAAVLLSGVLVAASLVARSRLDGLIFFGIVATAVLQIAAAGDKAIGAEATLMHGDRYYVLAKIAFAISLAVLADRCHAPGRLAGAAVLALLAPIAIINRGSLQRAPLPASNWQAHVDVLPAGPQRCGIEIPIQPLGWSVSLPPDTSCPAAIQVRPRMHGGLHDVRSTTVETTGSAEPDGFFPGVRKFRPSHLVPMRVWGTRPASDADTGAITLRTGPLCGTVALPYVTGPALSGLRVTVERSAPDGGLVSEQVAGLAPSTDHWSMIVVSAPREYCSDYVFIAEDAGRGWGQWIAIGTPRAGQWEAWR